MGHGKKYVNQAAVEMNGASRMRFKFAYIYFLNDIENFLEKESG